MNNKEIELLENREDFSFLKDFYSKIDEAEKYGVSRYEIRHSNFLAWIFRTNSNNNLEKFAIKELLKIAGYNTNFNILDVKVIREKEFNIDLFIKVKTEEDGTKYIIIENKVYALLGDEQLEKYKSNITKKYNIINPVLIYLHPNFNNKVYKEQLKEAINNGYIGITYQQIYENILEKILKLTNSYEDKYSILNYIHCLAIPKEEDDYGIIVTEEEKECLCSLINTDFIKKMCNSIIDGEINSNIYKYYKKNESLYNIIYKKYIRLSEFNSNITSNLVLIKNTLNSKQYIFNNKRYNSIKKMIIDIFDELMNKDKRKISELDLLINIYEYDKLLVHEISDVKHQNYYDGKTFFEEDGEKYYLLTSWISSDYKYLKYHINKLKDKSDIYKNISLD